MFNLKEKLEDLEQERMAQLNDPRLQLPGVTFYGQGGLGCGFTIASILPFAPLALLLFVDDPEGVRLLQWFLGGFTAFWALTWVMNYAHVGKLRHQGKPGSAVLVDRFEYRDSEGDTQRVMVYETAHPQTGEPTRVMAHSQVAQDRKMNIGTRIEFLRLPASKILTNLTSRVWPEMWSMTPKDKLANQVTGFAVISGTLLVFATLAGFQVLTAMVAFELTWSDVLRSTGDLRIVDYLTSPELRFWYREVAARYQILLPTALAAMVTVIGAAFFQVVGMMGEE